MKEQQALVDLYQQRNQIQAKQQALVNQPQPHSPYQTIHIEASPEIIRTPEQQYGSLIDENQRLQQQLSQQMQYLNVCIQAQEDKLNAVEKEAMQWLQGTSQNERREVKRTKNAISAESTFKSNPDSHADADISTVLFLGISTLALVAFIINELMLFIKANPEVIGFGLITVFALFFVLKKFNKGQQS